MSSKWKECFWTKRDYDNSDSQVRDFNALDRTFLAWMRTALAGAGLGIIIVRLYIQSGNAAQTQSEGNKIYIKVLGCGFIIVGFFMLTVGVTRYVEIFNKIAHDKYPANGRGMLFSIIFLAILFIGLLVLIIWGL